MTSSSYNPGRQIGSPDCLLTRKVLHSQVFSYFLLERCRCRQISGEEEQATMSSILESMQNLLTRVHRKIAQVPIQKNEKEVLRLRILGQTLQGLQHPKRIVFLPPLLLKQNGRGGTAILNFLRILVHDQRKLEPENRLSDLTLLRRRRLTQLNL